MLKILHTADIHLGAPFRALGERGKEQREQLKKTFAAVVQLALNEKVDLFLIAGDLFDSQSQPQSTVDFVVEEFGKLQGARIPVALIAGTHDYLKTGNLYRRIALTEQCPNVTLFDEHLKSKVYPELDLTIFGRSLVSNQSRKSPLAGLIGPAGTRFKVGLIHGSYFVEGRTSPTDHVFLQEEIDDSGLDYLACGHWHSYYELPTSVKAAYCGAPEMIDLDHAGSGQVIFVSLDDGRVKIETVRVGKRRSQKLELSAGDFPTPAAFKKFLSAQTDPDLVLEVAISGLVNLRGAFSFQEIADSLRPSFFHLRFRDQTHPRLESIDPETYPAELVIGRFVRLMKDRIEAAADDKDRKIAEEALQYGVALLSGQEVI